MPRENRSSVRDVASIVAGSALGAVVRYVTFQCWPTPAHLLITTLVPALSGFALVGFVLTSRAGPEVRAFVAGVCGAITSVSVYVAIGISQPRWAAIALLVLTPVAIVAGLIVGALVGVSINARRMSASAPK
jgi:fluoride ion exporter CrcB/FEX